MISKDTVLAGEAIFELFGKGTAYRKKLLSSYPAFETCLTFTKKDSEVIRLDSDMKGNVPLRGHVSSRPRGTAATKLQEDRNSRLKYPVIKYTVRSY